MKEVMVKAWKIAKDAVAKFGGSAKEYFSGALKMAWTMVKNAASAKANEIALQNRNRAYAIDAALPTLIGSEKQIKWAENFRNSFLNALKHKIDGLVSSGKVSAEKATAMFNPIAVWAVENKTEASYWIELSKSYQYSAIDAMEILRKMNAESGIVKRPA